MWEYKLVFVTGPAVCSFELVDGHVPQLNTAFSCEPAT
jgi:hypothetical protein